MEQLVSKEEVLKAWEEPFEWDTETVKWLNSRPQVIKDLILRFPLDCKVKGTIPLRTPAQGEVGIVASYFESGLVAVVVPGKNIKAQCQPEWLELVECRPGMTVEDIKEKLQ